MNRHTIDRISVNYCKTNPMAHFNFMGDTITEKMETKLDYTYDLYQHQLPRSDEGRRLLRLISALAIFLAECE